MGKRQRDCVDCGAPVGFLEREHCCRCVRRIREAAVKAPCPDCGKQRVLQPDTGRCVLCSRRCIQCGHPVRSSSATICRPCRRKAELLAAQRPCPRCARPGYLRADTGWCGPCRGRGHPSNRPESAGNAARCGAMPDLGCAHRAGSAIRIGPSSARTVSSLNSRNRQGGCESSPGMWPLGSVRAEQRLWSPSWAGCCKTSIPTSPPRCLNERVNRAARRAR